MCVDLIHHKMGVIILTATTVGNTSTTPILMVLAKLALTSNMSSHSPECKKFMSKQDLPAGPILTLQLSTMAVKYRH